MSGHLSAFLRGMTRYDAYFHLLLGGALVGGLLFMNTAGETLWNSRNKGVSQHQLQTTAACNAVQVVLLSKPFSHTKGWIAVAEAVQGLASEPRRVWRQGSVLWTQINHVKAKYQRAAC